MSIFKLVTLKHEGENMLFLFPFAFDDAAITSAVKAIRTGSPSSRNWVRAFLKDEVLITPVAAVELFDKCKYIVVYDEDNKDTEHHMVVFPRIIDHDNMFEVVQHAAYESTFINDQKPISIFSAGFVLDKQCFGNSETLQVKSDKGDTALYKKLFI